MHLPHLRHVIDSHTEGEPTRVVIAGGPDIGRGPIAERLERLRMEYDSFRSGVVCEPRGCLGLVSNRHFLEQAGSILADWEAADIDPRAFVSALTLANR